MAPPTSGHGRSPSNIAEHIQLVLDRETSHENLQYVKLQMDKELAEERRRIEDPDEFKRLSTFSIEDLQSRVAALQGLQAILRAFLRRVCENLVILGGKSEGDRRGGGRGGRGGASAGLLQQKQSYEALLAEAEALVGGYLCMTFIRALVKDDTDALFHFVPGLPMPFVSSAAPGEGEEDEHDLYGRDFDLVRSEILHDVWGLNEGNNRNDLLAHRAPLEALLGPWWKPLMVGRPGHGSSSSTSSSSTSTPPSRNLLSLNDAPWLPWKWLMARLRRESDGGEPSNSNSSSSSSSFFDHVSTEVKELHLLTLYALTDALWSKAEGRVAISTLRTRLAEPFAAYIGLPRSLALAALAYWCADHPHRSGADDLALAIGGGKGGVVAMVLGKEGGERRYRQLVWMLGYWGRYEEAAHLMAVAPPPRLTPLDGCLFVGVLLGLGQWEQAFARQRALALPPSGPLSSLPPQRRLAPLQLLAYRLVESGRVGWLSSLPFSPFEEQHVVSTLYLSNLPTRDAAVLAFLLRRKQFGRAWAVFHLVAIGEEGEEGEGGREGREGLMKADLARLVQSVERFIPKEELEAMRRARGEGARRGGGEGEDAALLERFARLNPLEGGDGEGKEEEVMQEEEGGEQEPLGRRSYRQGPVVPGRRGGLGWSRGLGDGLGVDISGSPVSTGFEAAAAAAAGGSGRSSGRGQVEMMGMDTRAFVGPSGHEREWSSRMDMGVDGGEGKVGRGKLRSPPVALRPGRTERFDTYGAGEKRGGSGVGDGGYGKGISKPLGGRREEELI